MISEAKALCTSMGTIILLHKKRGCRSSRTLKDIERLLAAYEGCDIDDADAAALFNQVYQCLFSIS